MKELATIYRFLDTEIRAEISYNDDREQYQAEYDDMRDGIRGYGDTIYDAIMDCYENANKVETS